MDSQQEFLQRTAELYGKLQAQIDPDLPVYTPTEFERMHVRGFLQHALDGAQVRYRTGQD